MVIRRRPVTLLTSILANEKVRFLLVGAYNTLFGYLTFAVLFVLVGKHMHYLAVSVLSHLIAVCNAFVLYRSFVFRARTPWPPQFVKFNISSLGSLGAGMLLLSTFVEILGFHPLLAQACALATAVCISYLLHKHISFR